MNGRHPRRRIAGFLIAVIGLVLASGPARAAGGGSASRFGNGPTAQDQEVSFTSGADTIYGSLLTPATSPGQQLPAALIISGSGPTDRDGNSTLIQGPVDTNLNFAQALAADGVVSLRYDKLGTGETGLASHSLADLQNLTFGVLIDEAQAAYQFLQSQPQVDPQRIMILGHSEGALIALILANRLQTSGDAPAALVLAAPPGTPILDTIRGQIAGQLMAAVQQGAFTSDQADATLAELDQIIRSIRQTGQLPADIPASFPQSILALFSPTNLKALRDEDSYDPPQLAAALPAGLPILILHGDKDQQISDGDVQNLLDALNASGHTDVTSAELTNVDHVFKEVPGTPNPATDYGNPNLSFSQEAVALLSQFVASNLASPATGAS